MTAVLTPPRASTRSQTLLSINEAEFAQNFTQVPFFIKHSLGDHPLFQVERLLKLAQDLPPSCIEYNAGNIPVSIEHSATPQNGLSPAETIRRIAECKSWLVLKYVERDPVYRELLNDCMREIAEHSEAIAPGMCSPQAFIFLTSPGSVTPIHIDPEHNFLLQVRGSKIVHLYDGRCRKLLPEQQLEHFYCDRGRNMEYDPSFEEKGWTFDLQPGQGLHFPVTYPHWVQNANEVSISFSITFRTPDLDRRRALYQMNDQLRRWKLSPAPVGQKPLRDKFMFNAYRTLRRLKLVGQPNKAAKY
jgi:hypothetical protein